MADIIWEDPPDDVKPDRFVWEPALEQVMQRPYKWAGVRSYKLEHSARASLSQLRNRKLKYPEGNWEFTVAKRDSDGRHWVYARFDGN
jgi:hypothetical protein